MVRILAPPAVDFWILDHTCGRKTGSPGVPDMEEVMETIVHSEPLAVARRLRELGLTLDVLLNAVTAAYQACSTCTELDPRMYPGLTMWAVAIRHLRAGLLPRWQAKDDGNFSITVSPDDQVAIAVATGDDGTGIAERIATTQSSKGPRTMEAVAANNKQMGFELTFPDGWIPPLYDPAKFGDCATWILLIHRDDTAVRAELSHPLGIDENKRVSGWRERILLPSIDTGPLVDVEIEDREVPVDVPVHRKA